MNESIDFKKSSVSLRTKILLLVYLLASATFWVGSVQILRLSHNQLMDYTFESARNDQFAFGESIKGYTESLKLDINSGLLLTNIQEAIKSHVRYQDQNEVTFRIMGEDGVLICSNMAIGDMASLQLSPAIGRSAIYYLKNIDGRNVIFVSSFLSLYGQLYRIDYARDITKIVQDEMNLAWRISLVTFFAIALLLIFLYVGIKRILKPFIQLGRQARAITNGNYDLRVKIVHNDEVGHLAEDFNNMAAAVQSHIDMLSEQVRLRELFAANFAHELKTPLTSIIGYSDIAERTNPEKEKLAKIHGYIKSEGERLDALSAKLLSWSEITQTGEIDVKPCDTGKILEHIQHSISSQLESKNQKLIEYNKTDILCVDEVLFISLLTNLCTNASKASEAGQDIELYLDYDSDGAIVLRVDDHGVGIKKDELDRLTEPFYMVDKARDRSQGGTGLGLTLCDVIAKAHRGKMLIESQPGFGTSVKVTIPQPPVKC